MGRKTARGMPRAGEEAPAWAARVGEGCSPWAAFMAQSLSSGHHLQEVLPDDSNSSLLALIHLTLLYFSPEEKIHAHVPVYLIMLHLPLGKVCGSVPCSNPSS